MALAVAAATANPKKLREIEEIFASAVGDGVELLPRPAELPDVVEDGDTLAANAELKARAVAEEVDSTHRTARFRTVICLARPGREPLFAEGVCEGRIARSPSGDGGFGYDPVFVPDDGDGRTFAQMDASEKHAISHRGRAMVAAAALLREFLTDER